MKLNRSLAPFTLLFSVIIFSSCTFSQRASRNMLSRSGKEAFDAIVIPGVPFNQPNWEYTMKGRVYWSKYLYDHGYAKNIIYSGSSVYSPYFEGIIMALYAEALGIPREHIFSETKAEHSTENIYYSYKKAKQLGFQKVALASDPFQTKMLHRYGRKIVSADLGFLPMVYDSLNTLKPQMTDPKIDYSKAFNPMFKSIMERQSFWQRLRGTRGHNVDVKAYE